MDRERDKRIAEALGWTDGEPCPCGCDTVRATSPDGKKHQILPRYSQPEHAFTLLEELLRRGWRVIALGKYDDDYMMTIRNTANARRGGDCDATADSLADAIASAFEKAEGKYDAALLESE